MKDSKLILRKNQLLLQKIILLNFLLLLFFIPIHAQNPNSAQWTSAGGEMIMSGNHNFTISWVSDAYSRQDGNKWWPGGFWDAGDTRKYTPWEDAVKNSVSPKIAEITVLGPGNIGLLQRWKKGSRIYMNNSETKAGFTPWINSLEWYNGKWAGTVMDYNPAGEFWGAVPAGVEITLDIYAIMSEYNNQGGTGEISFVAPQEVEYEVWFFPREGGKVISVTQSSGGFDKPQPGIVYYTDKECK